jgi:hypothetical protein
VDYETENVAQTPKESASEYILMGKFSIIGVYRLVKKGEEE